jgi:hypothetical protein
MATTFHYRNGGILAGSTSVITYAYLQTVAGAPVTGLAFGSATASYTRQGGALTSVTLSAGTPGGAWGSGKFIEVDATNCPGLYRIDWPDAAFAAGSAESVTLSLKSTGNRPVHDQQPLQLDQSIWGGEAITGATRTSIPTAGLPTLSAGQLNRRLLQFLSGPCAGQRVLIVGQTSGNVLQVAPPLTAAPSDGDPFCIL